MSYYGLRMKFKLGNKDEEPKGLKANLFLAG